MTVIVLDDDDDDDILCVPLHIGPALALAPLLDGEVGVAHQVDVEFLAAAGVHAGLEGVEVCLPALLTLPASLAPPVALLKACTRSTKRTI